jgi:hypothetical protein
MWNSVDIYGPQSEIDRFKRLFIVPGPANDWEDNTQSIDFDRGDIYPCYAWNFRELGKHEHGVYSFAFDTVSSFPINTFGDLVDLFPKLAFDCEYRRR